MNFLLGSGASVGLLPTLSLSIKNSSTSESHTFETLAAHFADNKEIMALLFSYYVRDVILPAASFNAYDTSALSEDAKEAVANYEKFLKSVLTLIEKKSSFKRANIFTTNYDGMVAHAAENLIHSERWDFTLNDGGVGFSKRKLQVKNFSRYVKEQGVFDRHERSVPQVNLIQPHGSVYWYKEGEQIEVSYDLKKARSRVVGVPLLSHEDFEKALSNESLTEKDIDGIIKASAAKKEKPSNLNLKTPEKEVEKETKNAFDEKRIENFWNHYETLPVVNPTKWKFHETVFEEHYYQALRLLSYELERPNSVFVVFGFSFADEHILNLVKRSLSNPTLKVFICCFSDATKEALQEKFEGARNIDFLRVKGKLNFTAFNDEVFSVDPTTAENPDDD
ncbi:SIR2 family protein [Leisingera sp. ANG-DT]|uniref:SIR2 family protein n=1 Tax=Leisingera sp. ANG-DT TaxID=1577897 RepID=UPI0019D33233|nr:SIR2 family protein [Leisingera sp. ANG-DT]